jgi:hypothetical protein
MVTVMNRIKLNNNNLVAAISATESSSSAVSGVGDPRKLLKI